MAIMTGFTPLLGAWSADSWSWPRTTTEVRQAALEVRSTSMVNGGGNGLAKADGWANRAGKLLDRRFDEPKAEACAWLWANVAFAHFDKLDLTTAKRFYRAALEAAELSGNTSLQARVLVLMSRLDMRLGHPENAVGHLTQARSLDGLVPAEVAGTWSCQARAAAEMNDPAMVDTCTGHAIEALREGGDRADRPWSAFYDDAHQAGDLGAAFGALQRHGHPVVAQATSWQQQAIDGHADGSRRSRALSTVSLATMEVSAGDFDHGIALGRHAVDSFAGIDSSRLREGFAGLARALAGYSDQPSAVELAGRLSA